MDEKILNELIEYLNGINHLPTEDIPDMDLYMDQVTGFMDQRLDYIKRHHEDKALTKTMINNYAKNRLLPAPVRKRYSRNHMLILLFIYYFKSVLSLTDIETILKPVNEKYFHQDSSPSLRDIYEEIFSLEEDQLEDIKQDVLKKGNVADTIFTEEDYPEISPEDREELRLFAFLGELGLDVYLKRQLMEKIVDKLHDRYAAATARSHAGSRREKK